MKSHGIFIYMWQDGPTFVSNYSIANGLSEVTLNYIPSDLPLESSVTWYIIFSIIYILVFIFLTVMLVLYVYFRSEPAIKATSVSLNILIFLGCYLLLLYVTIFNLDILPNYYMENLAFRNFMCTLRLWFNGLSLPSALIASVLLVKLVRVYRLFRPFSVVKKWQCHDVTLALYVLLLVSPFILSCVIQSTSNGFVSTIKTRTYNGNFIAYSACYKGDDESFLWWLFLPLAYLFVIGLLLIVMAFKTRKIKYENFKDT